MSAQLNFIEDKLDWLIQAELNRGTNTINPDPPRPRPKLNATE